MPDMSHTDKFATAVAFFLAEGLRTRTVSRQRAGEIAEKVLANLNLMDNEEQFLRLVKELSKDFEELKKLETQLETEIKQSKTRSLEDAIRQYAIQELYSEPHEALEILKAAALPDMTQEGICAAFPKFKEYFEKNAK